MYGSSWSKQRSYTALVSRDLLGPMRTYAFIQGKIILPVVSICNSVAIVLKTLVHVSDKYDWSCIR